MVIEMISKKIFYKNKGMENEDYAFLDYDEDSGEFSVRQGYSYKESGSTAWDGEENVYDVDDFLEQHPKYTNKVNNLIENIES